MKIESKNKADRVTQKLNQTRASEKMTNTAENYVAEIDQTDAAVYIHEKAVAAYSNGDSDRAESLMMRSLKLLEKTEDPVSPDAAAVMSDLGAIYENRSDYTRAERFYKKSISIIMKAPGDQTDIQTLRVRTLTNQGRIHRTMGEYYKAEMLFLRALTIAEQSFGPDSLESAGVMSDLAMLYKYMDRFNEAEQLYKRALQIREKI